MTPAPGHAAGEGAHHGPQSECEWLREQKPTREQRRSRGRWRDRQRCSRDGGNRGPEGKGERFSRGGPSSERRLRKGRASEEQAQNCQGSTSSQTVMEQVYS
jgi:hypothetical protein